MSEVFKQIGEFVSDKLIAGNQIPPLTQAIKLAAGTGVLTRGTLIATDGTVANKEVSTLDEVEGILCDDVTLAEGAQTDALIYITGEFLGSEVTVGAGATIGEFSRELRKLGIIIR